MQNLPEHAPTLPMSCSLLVSVPIHPQSPRPLQYDLGHKCRMGSHAHLDISYAMPPCWMLLRMNIEAGTPAPKVSVALWINRTVP